MEMKDIPMGHIFETGKVVGQDAYGRWLVKVNKITVILQDKYIPRGTNIKRGGELQNLVVVNLKKCLHVAIDSYMDKLKSHYYSENNRPKKELWGLWHKRWEEECGELFPNNFSIKESNINLGERARIFALQGRDYVIPISGYKDLRHLISNPLFYPGTFYKNQLERCVYKTDNVSSFPKVYEAEVSGKIINARNVVKQVKVFLHGYTSPAKWHYGVWRHLLALAPCSDSKERKLWQKLLKERIDTGQFGSLFSDCKISDSSCDELNCVRKNLFSRVQQRIKDYCNKYLNQIVTSFESITTNRLRIYDIPNEDCKEIELYFKNDLIIYFKGKCHNWSDSKPVLHLIPITMYLGSNILPWRDKLPQNRLIFDGVLKVVEKR